MVCCEYMKKSLEDEDITIEPTGHEIMFYNDKTKGPEIMNIWFCPWCGKSLHKE